MERAPPQDWVWAPLPGRHKSFPVETEGYFYQVVRYVERNALRTNLVTRAEEWPWSSLRRGERDDAAFPLLSSWPLPRPVDWLEIVNQPQSEAELDALRRCVHRGSPYFDCVLVLIGCKLFGKQSFR